MSKYLTVLTLCVIVPFVLSFFPPIRLFRHTKALILSILGVVLVFGIWDIFATWRGHWSFDKNAVYDVRVINLPLEEVLFFIVIPFCCIFSWEVINYFKKKIR